MAAGVPVAQGSARVTHRSRVLPTQVLLQQELEQLGEELDKDMRAMETRQQPRKVPGPLLPPLGLMAAACAPRCERVQMCACIQMGV